MNKPFKPGHLKEGGEFAHKQTAASRYLMSKKTRQHNTLTKWKAPELNWRPPK